jgi:alpha-glucosidase
MYGILAGSAFVAAASARAIAPRQTNDSVSCPGYSASNVKQSGTGLSADLSLAGAACNSFGTDIENLRLTVSYDTGMLLGVNILRIRS